MKGFVVFFLIVGMLAMICCFVMGMRSEIGGFRTGSFRSSHTPLKSRGLLNQPANITAENISGTGADTGADGAAIGFGIIAAGCFLSAAYLLKREDTDYNSK